MSRKKPIHLPNNDYNLADYSKEFYSSHFHQGRLKQIEKEADRIERLKERKSDRRFILVTLLIGSILGAVFTKHFDFIDNYFFLNFA